MEMKQNTDDHSLESNSKTLNRFIAKTYHIINSDEPTAIWVRDGKSFLIVDTKKFSETVLPKYFKHSKFTSFVRQLNFYGFHKIRIDPKALMLANENIPSEENGGKIVCFQHRYFQADQPKLLERIQRTTRQSPPIVAADLPSSTQQKEIESLQNQLQDMREQIECMRDEYEVKLASTRAELELDYLHRIRAIEVCYKDLILMMVPSKEMSELSLERQGRDATGPAEKRLFPPTSRSSNSTLFGPNNNFTDFLLKSTLKKLAKTDDKRVRTSLQWPLPKSKDFSFGNTGGRMSIAE